MDEPDYCEGCTKMTRTIHGRCADCWHAKVPEAITTVRSTRSSSVSQIVTDQLIDLAWFFPGAVLAALALFVLGDDILLATGLVLLLFGGILKSGDFFP